jgi:hypothetical protein
MARSDEHLLAVLLGNDPRVTATMPLQNAADLVARRRRDEPAAADLTHFSFFDQATELSPHPGTVLRGHVHPVQQFALGDRPVVRAVQVIEQRARRIAIRGVFLFPTGHPAPPRPRSFDRPTPPVP